MAAGRQVSCGDSTRRGKLGGILAIGGSRCPRIVRRRCARLQSASRGQKKLRSPPSRRRDRVRMSALVRRDDDVLGVDIAGVNRVSARSWAKPRARLPGWWSRTVPELAGTRRSSGCRTMFGVTNACATRAARERLEELGYEVLVFPATGAGGRQSSRRSSRWGSVGVRPRRRRARRTSSFGGGWVCGGMTGSRTAGAEGGSRCVARRVDMVTRAREPVPSSSRGRNLYVAPNPTITLMNDAEECAELGRHGSAGSCRATGPTVRSSCR